MQLKEELIP